MPLSKSQHSSEAKSKTGIELAFWILGAFLLISTVMGFVNAGPAAALVFAALWSFFFLYFYLIKKFRIKSNWKTVTVIVIIYQVTRTAITMGISALFL